MAEVTFPKQADYPNDRNSYLRALAGYFGLSPDVVGEGGGIIVPREAVPAIVRELHAQGEGYGQVMCKEYGDDSDWNGIELEDVENWAEWAKDAGQDPTNAVDEEYQTFELW